MDKGGSVFERDPDRAVDSPTLSAEDGDMISAEDVFLGSSSESDSITNFFLCNTVDDIEIVA